MTQLIAFVREDATKPFEKWLNTEGRSISITFSGQRLPESHVGASIAECELFSNDHDPRCEVRYAFNRGNLALLRDIDPDNIPDEIRCVVCKGVTDELVEGDMARLYPPMSNHLVRVVFWDDDSHSFLMYQLEPDDDDCYRPSKAIPKDPSQIVHVGHVLTHRIKNGEVVER